MMLDTDASDDEQKSSHGNRLAHSRCRAAFLILGLRQHVLPMAGLRMRLGLDLNRNHYLEMS